MEVKNFSHVIILGAGASFPYGFPTGAGLINEIKEFSKKMYEDNPFEVSGVPPDFYEKKLPAQNLVYGNYRIKGWDGKSFYNTLCSGHFDSIDEFFDIYKDDGCEWFADFGKQLIAYIILQKEVISSGIEDFGNDNWYQYLWSKFKNIFLSEKPHVAFITFNYDRSLEHFLLKQLIAYKKPQAHLSKIPIIHVYGSLGDIETFSFACNDRMLFKRFADTANNIRTIFESKTNPENVNFAQELIQNAHRIFITGFGFDELNVDVIFKNKFKGHIMINGYKRTTLRMNEVKDLLIRYRNAPFLAEPYIKNFKSNLEFFDNMVSLNS